MNFKSKITWINIIGIVISIIGAVSGNLTPTQAVYASTTVQILTIFLRQLQGKTISLAGRKITL